MIHQYNYPTSIRFGPGAVAELPAYLKDNKIAAPLLVTDPNVKQLGFFKGLVQNLKNGGLAVEVFAEMHKNPVKSDVLAGDQLYKSANCDAIIGIGGGVAMDVARSIALRVNHTELDLFDYDDLIGGSKYIINEIPHFVCIPTTSGTGSEVGRSAIISEDESKKKRILFHPTLMAKQVFADPELTYELPAFITAATGMDALTHNIEAFLAKGVHPMADGIALEAIRIITNNIETATNKPDEESRANMMIASLMGAVAFQKGLGVVHSLAHPLSALVDMHHGLANAICLPYGMAFNYSGFEKKFNRIAQAMNIDSGSEVVSQLHSFNEKLGMPSSLGQQGITEMQIEPLSALAVVDFCHPSNPKPVTEEDFKNLYIKAL